MNKIYSILTGLCILVFTPSYSQSLQPSLGNTFPAPKKTQEKCLTQVLHNDLMQKDANYRNDYNSLQAILDAPIAGPRGVVYKVPVIVHIMHLNSAVGTAENISDAQVYSAMKSLNESFRKKAGTAGDGAGVDTEIEFCLAQKDPSGNPHTGINRVYAGGTSDYATNGLTTAGTNNEVTIKALSKWDNTKYYNVWIVTEIDGNNGGSGTQGFAYYPSTSNASKDGAVMLYNSFGFDPDGSKGYNLKSYTNRNVTFIHEMGHGFNVMHTFEGESCTETNCSTGGDRCCDTPPTRSTSDCVTKACTNSQIQNYMDYTDDICQNMFTADQTTRMRNTFSVAPRASLVTTANLTACGCDIPVVLFSANNNTVCTGTSIQFTDESLNFPTSWSWTVTGGTPATSTSQDPLISYPAGTYSVTLTATTAAGISKTLTKTNYLNVYAPPSGTPCAVNTSSPGNYGTGIKNVTLNTLNSSSGDALADGGYKNFVCNRTTNLALSTTYTISITAGNATNNEYVRVFIDYNNNGNFTDPGENVVSTATANGVRTGTFTTPASPATNQLIRMRVISDLSNPTGPCDAPTIGQAEDYGVYFQTAPQKPAADFSGTPTSSCTAPLTVNFTDLSANAPTSWAWDFQNDGIYDATTQNPSFVYSTAGTYAVKLKATNAIGTDSITKTGYITIGGGVSLPLIEGFESATFVPTNWSLNNPDADVTWVRSTAAGSGSTASTLLDNFSSATDQTGKVDDLITPKIDFSGKTSAWVTFDVAYAPYNNTVNFDSLIVYYSIDCGVSWIRTSYARSGNTTASPTLATVAAQGTFFVPNSTQWRKDSINLNSIAGQAVVQLKFQNKSGWGNNLYIDNINIQGSTSTLPVANFSGTPVTGCGSLVVNFTDLSTGSPTSWAWDFDNSGSTDATTQNPTYTYSAPGTYTVKLTATNGSGSDAEVKTAYITVGTPATVSAGADQTICRGSTVALAGSVGGSATSGTWSGGTGTFSPNATTLNATYTPGATETSVTLTLTTNDPAGSCTAASDQMVITINPVATANAGADQTICKGSTVTLAGTVGGSATSGTWSGGTGTFSPNATTLNATYNPGATETSVTLTLTTNDPAGPCNAATDQMVITINPVATANAGADQTICKGSTVTLAGSVGGSATSGTWSGGTGTFSPNATTLNATYTPGATETSVTLTLTTNDPTGPCPAVSDAMVITINPVATANAGADQTICKGSTVTLAGTVGGSATSGTWSGGTGTFSPNATTLNATYTPGATETSVTLTLTTNDPAGPCPAVTDQMVITINPVATANAGADQSTCVGSTVTLAGAVGGSATSGTWSGGTGTFSPNATTLNATYTPGATETSGTVTLTLTTNDPAGPCNAVTDQIVITINSTATANAGADQGICKGSTVTLTGSVGGAATSGTWSGGTGTFSPNATTLNATYTPGATETSVTLTLTTNDPAGSCTAASDQMVITINPVATANAGTDQTICKGSTVTLAGSVGGSATTGTWSGGTGTFSPNATTLNATYTPGTTETSVTLTLTTNDPAGPCPALTDQMVITINPVATANAGADQTICKGSTVTLAGSVGGSATTATWTTSGSGTFSSATSMTAVYTPSSADITAGTVTLTLTTNDPAGPCPTVTDQVVITINPIATANAGADQSTCVGSTVTLAGAVGASATTGTWSGGTGTFSPNATTLNATYTPGATETSGTVTLTLTTNDPTGPCNAVSDQMVITINSTATANAGADQSICKGSTIALAGSIGGAATSGTWSGGTGTFSPNAATLNATYTPGATETSVTLTLTTNDPAGSCTAASDQMVITINPVATANAGADQTICKGSTVTLAGSVGGSATSGTWSGGTGTFSPNATTLNATYTPGATETSVTLTLTTNDPAGPCNAIFDQMVITINPVATANAGADQTICKGSTVTLAGSVGGSATTGTWSGGTGTFSPNATTLNATYTPGATETSVTLILTTNDPAGSCPAVFDQMVIIINPVATANAGTDQAICKGSTVTLAGAVGGAATSGTWSGGTGTFSPNSTTLNATYTPGATETSVTLTLTTNDPAGPCNAVNDAMVITINPVATANAGADQSTCVGSTITLAGAVGGSATTGTWSGGTGTFSPNATTLNATYTPGATETSGTVTLTLTTNDPTGPCNAVSDQMVITINSTATANAGADQAICKGSTVTLASSIGGAASTGTWSGGTGTFSPNATTLNATYTPGATETSVTLTLTTNDPAGPCPAVTDQIVITINPIPIATATPSSQTLCSGGTIGIALTSNVAGTIFAWTVTQTPGISGASAGSGSNIAQTLSNSGTTAGTATYTITSTANGCSGMPVTVTITVNPNPTFTVSTSNPTTCGGSDGSITLSGLTASTAFNITYTKDGTGIGPVSMTSDASGNIVIPGLTQGMYRDITVELSGCSLTDGGPYTLASPSGLSASIASQTNISCFGGNNGSVTIAGSGTSGYTYAIDGTTFQASGTFSGLTEGNYTVTVKDVNGCMISVPVTITEPTVLIASITSQTNVSTNGGNNGSVTVSASGGTTSYTYSIDGTNFQASGTFSGLSAGTYTITVKDAKGCTISQSVTITEPSAATPIFGTPTVTPASCNGCCDGAIVSSVSGGTGPYTFTWSPNVSTGSSADSLCAGIYILCVTDGNGSSTCDTITITQPSVPITFGTPVVTNTGCNGCCDGSIVTIVSGGTGPLSFTWSPNVSTGSSVDSLCAGTYIVCATDSVGTQKCHTITVSSGTDIATTEKSVIGISLYPNPAKHSITVDIASGKNANATLTLTNLLGQQLHSESIYLTPSIKKNVDVNMLAPGVYFINVKTDEGTTVKKFVKN